MPRQFVSSGVRTGVTKSVSSLGVQAYHRRMDAHAVVMMVVLAGMLAASVAGPQRMARLRRRLVGAVERATDHARAAHPGPPRAAGRPIEEIARDAYRLGHRFRYVPEDASFARFEGRRRAYDQVLTEACAALGIDHLLGVVPPGVELDQERARVEVVLDRAGLRLDDAA